MVLMDEVVPYNLGSVLLVYALPPGLRYPLSFIV